MTTTTEPGKMLTGEQRDNVVKQLRQLNDHGWRAAFGETCWDYREWVLATLDATARADVGDGTRQEERAWLIERGDSEVSAPSYWGWDEGHSGDDGHGFDWTKDNQAALRFGRKLDAERYVKDAGWNNVRICEHGWYGPCVGEHQWFVPEFIGYECCKICGIVKRTDGKENKPCRGPTSVGPRSLSRAVAVGDGVAEMPDALAEFEARPIQDRLRAPAYWMSGSGQGHEGENDLPFKAADEIDHLSAKLQAAERGRDAWTETARFHCGNEEYYRGLVQKIGAMLGEYAYTQDDGGKVPDVLCAKVPEVVEALVKHDKQMDTERAYWKEFESRALTAEAALADMTKERDNARDSREYKEEKKRWHDTLTKQLATAEAALASHIASGAKVREVIEAAEIVNRHSVERAQVSAQLAGDNLYRVYMGPERRKLDEAFQAYYEASTSLVDKAP